jgi:CRISPR-associated protein Csb2
VTVTLEVRFPGGSYHATPWGSHVNEGLVEWPPSPWRLLRALVAVGFGRLGWTAVPAVGSSLLRRLSSVLPEYWLPKAAAGHSRHYMPPFKGNTTKVLDAFAHIEPGDRLLIAFEVVLPDEERALLDELVERLPYLGRAESWVEVRCVDAPNTTGLTRVRCSGVAPESGDWEPIRLLAVLDSDALGTWCQDTIARALEQREGEERAKLAAKGMPFKALSAKEKQKVTSAFPASLVEVLLQDTATMRGAGWSMPAGSRWVVYWRPESCLVPRPTLLDRRRDAGPPPTTALLALSSDTRQRNVFPPRKDTVRRLEMIHQALVRLSDARGEGQASVCFTGGGDTGARSDHRHAYLVPLTLGDRADRLDHVLVHAPGGLDEAARQALTRVERTWAKNCPELFVTLVGMGAAEAFGKKVKEMDEAIRWESRTPFVPSRHVKARGKDSLLGQVLAECGWHGLPAPESVEIELDGGGGQPGREREREGERNWVPAEQVVLDRHGGLGVRTADGDRAIARTFVGFGRRRETRPPPIDVGLSLRLTFAKPVRGLVAIGYGAHFGLGLMAPVREGEA